jgi:hypothetical protein
VKWKSFFVKTHFFLEVAERPEGVPAPFWKKGFLQKRLEWKAGNSSLKNTLDQIEIFQFPIYQGLTNVNKIDF